MILTEVSAPPAAAVPVRAFAEHLRLGSGFADDGSEDVVLELYLRAAMAAIEARLGRALLARGFSWTVTRWREDASQGLPVGPVRSVESVTLVDADGAETAVPPDAWSVLRDSQRPRLDQAAEPAAQLPARGEAVGVAAAVDFLGGGAPHGPEDFGVRLLLRQVRKVDQGVGGGVSCAHHEDPLSCEPGTLAARDVRECGGNPLGGGRLTRRRQPGGAERIAGVPRAGGINDTRGTVLADFSARVFDPEQERRCVAAAAVGLVHPEPRHGHDARAGVQPAGDGRQCGEGCQVRINEFAAEG